MPGHRPRRSLAFNIACATAAGGALAALLLLVRGPGPDPTPKPDGLPPAGAIVESEASVLPRYAGSETCKRCHADQHTKWSESHHALAERGYRPELDDLAFEPTREVAHGTETSQIGRFEQLAAFLTAGFGGDRGPYPVVRAIGHDPLRQFLVGAPDGRLQAMDLCWDPHRTEWFHVYGDEDRQPGEWGHWTGRGMNWESMCAGCHNTRLRKNYDPESDGYRVTMAEMGVGCEACHGPMRAHVEWQAEYPGKAGDPNLARFTRDQHFDTCGACHARRTEITGDLVPGESFHDHFGLTIPDQSEIYYADGQVREEDYEFASLLGSGMHAAGVRCVDCHDPHSGARLLPGNDLCMRCHTGGTTPMHPLTAVAPAIDPEAHGHHPSGSAGNDCTGCHMPLTVYMQRHPRHDHGFTIPDPLLTTRFGIPNACNRCHEDRDAEWALGVCEEWYGDRMDRPSRHRAILFAEAREGLPAARDRLIAFLGDAEPTAPWRASACLLLGQWVFDPPARAAIVRNLSHPHPLVRAAAAHALNPAAQDESGAEVRATLYPLTSDPARNVRVAAAWALRGSLDLKSTAGRELLHSLEINADQPAGQMRLGQFDFARSEPDRALAHLRQAIEWDPNSPPFHHDLAVMLNLTGDTSGAVASLREAVRLDPNSAAYHYRLALALHEDGSLAEATRSLEKTVELDPGHGRAWYNLGLAYHSLGRTEEAIETLSSGESASPQDPAIPYALATILIQLDRREEAARAAERALRIQPGMPQAIRLLQSIAQGR